MTTAIERTPVPDAFDSFRELIGSWRGVGQVRRGSSRGAWTESAEWRYDFSESKPRLVLDIEDGVHLDRLVIESRDRNLVATIETADAQVRPASVTHKSGGKTVFFSQSDDRASLRLTLTRLGEKRSLLLIESKPAGSQVFRRLGEVGYTRAGTKLATAGSGGPECIVTGGKGTIEVTHNGKTYYVCCTGCKQAFEADPEAILAEAAERAADPE